MYLRRRTREIKQGGNKGKQLLQAERTTIDHLDLREVTASCDGMGHLRVPRASDRQLVYF
jgi:hypothetical protein